MYYRTSFPTRREATDACIAWIEGFYNRRRPHSAVGYRHPAELMEEFEERMEVAFGPGRYLENECPKS
jgi:transposase InsO family protein